MVNSDIAVIKELGRLLDAPVYGEVPPNRPKSFVTVERVAGKHGLIIDKPTFAIQTWAGSKAEASKLAYKVADVFDRLPETTPMLGAADVVSIYSFPDPESRSPRFQLTANAVFIKQ